MPYDKSDYPRSGERSSQAPDFGSAYGFGYDDSDVLTDPGNGERGASTLARPYPEFAYERSSGAAYERDGDRDRTDFSQEPTYGRAQRYLDDDEGYRPEVDYDPDYQQQPDYESDHAQEFQRIDAQIDPRPPRPRRARTARRRRNWVRWLVVVLVVLVALVGVAAAVAYRYADRLISGQQTSVQNTAVAEAGEPINIVLVGSDSREGAAGAELDQSTEDVGGERADTIMVLHVNPEQKKAVLVSIPRDLQTEVNGEITKINAAGAGGPSLIVQTVEQTTGLDINHYVEIDFAGFLEVVDTVGGVELCNDTGEPLVDRMAGLNMPPGCHNFNGEHALAFVRARYIDSDFGRIERQQQFIRALLAKISSTGNLINPPRLISLANDLSGAVTTDQEFSAGEAIRIAQGMGSLSLDDVDMRIYPSQGRGPECDGCAAFVHGLPEAQILMQAIAAEAEELPPVGLAGEENVTLADTTLRVVNGSEIDGAAAETAEALEEIGMTTSVEGNTETPVGATTQISYGENMAEEAELLSWLLRGTELQLVPADPESGPGPNSLTLIIGSSWPGVEAATSSTGAAGGVPGAPVVPGGDGGDSPGLTDPGLTDPGLADQADPAEEPVAPDAPVVTSP